MKKISIIILALAVLLSGCQLAKPEVEAGKDKLVGVFVTTEYIDLFDMEAYLNDNLDQLDGGMIQADQTPYRGRLYAELVPVTLTGEDGEEVQHWEYQFPDLEGVAYFAARVQTGTEDYVGSNSDLAILDGHMDIKYTDTAEEIALTARILRAHEGKSIEFYPNPVYQTADGQVYLTSGSGMSTSGYNAPGAFMTQTLSESTTITDGEETKTYSCSIAVEMGTMVPPEEYALVQMDDDNHILCTDRFRPGEHPEEITLLENTAYVLLETGTQEGRTRELWDRNTENLTTLYVGDNGFFHQAHTLLIWPQAV